MCGIVGFAGYSENTALSEALKALEHRGPDASGAEYFEGVALGNTRLAIIDLSSKGEQPMFNEDRSLCITFNGEIYNHLEIKKLLERKYKFFSGSDTEVILHAYKEWGVNCLKKFNGMFSFVIYDVRTKILFGARDRLGQKPLKYYLEGGKFIFASEIKAIQRVLSFTPEINEIAIDNFLTLQYIPSPSTAFKKIHKLPPAHYFLYRDNKLSTHRYWSLNFKKKLNLTKDEWVDLIYEEIKRSVKSHLISDVPVGAFLSGGLDSSTIVALMAKDLPYRIHTFSIGFNDERFDESLYAEKVSKMCNTKHTKILLSSRNLMENLLSLANFYDEPLGDNSILPTLLVSNLASKKVKVALSGDGGDENFAGYDRYTIVKISEIFKKFSKSSKDIFYLAAYLLFKIHPSKQTERINRFFKSLNNSFYRRYVNFNCFFTNEIKHDLYSSDFKNIIHKNDTFEIFEGLFDSKLSSLDNAFKIDVNTYLPDDLLYKSDIASMSSSLELRAPFLDHILMEKMASMPSDMKFNLGNKKKILKEIALKNKLLPKEIVFRPKQGFNIPQNKWFRSSHKKNICDIILSSNMVGKVFNKSKLEDYLNLYFNTNLSYDNNIFALLMLSQWFNKYYKA